MKNIFTYNNHLSILFHPNYITEQTFTFPHTIHFFTPPGPNQTQPQADHIDRHESSGASAITVSV